MGGISKQVNAESLLAEICSNAPTAAKFHPQANAHGEATDVAEYSYDKSLNTPAPKFKLQENPVERNTARNLVEELLSLDGKPELNLASFVNTEIDDLSAQLAHKHLTKNLADADEYPGLMNVHARCVSILSDLWNTPKDMNGVGTATTGSSEAIHLAGLAMKRRWEASRKKAGKSIAKPNIIMGANAQVALEKFARYFDVEARLLPVSAEAQYSFSMEELKKNIDENTIGVFVILGSTYTGHYQDVKAIEKVLDEFQDETGIDIPIHIDGASGAFVAPFVNPDLEWDFRVRRVNSINTSGHKFGLTVAGCGWIVWKDRQFLPDELLFTLSYLGGAEETFTLNFSRPGFPVIHQYYNLVRLGYDGYRSRHGGSLANARLFSIFLEATGWYECLSDIHRPVGQRKYDPEYSKTLERRDVIKEEHQHFNAGLPVVSFKFTDEFKKCYPEIPQQAVAMLMRSHGYIIPNYKMPPGEEQIECLRVVCRASMTVDFMEKLMEDIVRVTKHLIDGAEKVRKSGAKASGVYDALQLIMMADSDESEHKEYWVKHEESGTRLKHPTGC